LYLSRIYIENYRSIKELDLSFKKGKNVIVGKNNAGKSNIIKAIDLVLGEKSPTWNKSNNITENDFFEGNTDEKIFIWCELTKERGEIFDLSSYKGAFYKLKDKQSRELVKIDFSPSDDKISKECFFHFFSEDFFDTLDRYYRKEWIGTKSYCNSSFDAELIMNDKFVFVFVCQKNDNDIFDRNMIFLYKKNAETEWNIAFNANIRNLLLQSAIIPSFRDPINQLRITDYTWYGKLLKEYIPKNDDSLEKAFNDVKVASNAIFKKLCDQISGINTQIAFPNTKIHFQFNPDTKQDIFKSTLIYVDDGFNTKLEDKGAGIQSSVIISLFDFYVRNIAHANGSLLAIEEPELYLHPHGRRVISDRLDTFLDGSKNQVIITTHSPEFICSPDDSINLIVVKKEGNRSIAKNFYFNDIKVKQILVKKQNSEMFFADAVILVEGADKYILESICKEFGNKKQHKLKNITENWLNDHNVSIVNCGGKHEFWKYAHVLNDLEIPFMIICDFDFFRNGLDNYLGKVGMNNGKSELSGIKSKVTETIRCGSELNEIHDLCDEIKRNVDLDELNKAKKSANQIEKIIKKNTGTYKKLDDISNKDVRDEIRGFIDKLKQSNIFLLTGELEDFYALKTEFSKEQGVLEIINMCGDNKISEFIYVDEFEEALCIFIQNCILL
jgi:predicted ATP-dependent endonuclease of OLD family